MTCVHTVCSLGSFGTLTACIAFCYQLLSQHECHGDLNMPPLPHYLKLAH